MVNFLIVVGAFGVALFLCSIVDAAERAKKRQEQERFDELTKPFNDKLDYIIEKLAEIRAEQQTRGL